MSFELLVFICNRTACSKRVDTHFQKKIYKTFTLKLCPSKVYEKPLVNSTVELQILTMANFDEFVHWEFDEHLI